MNECTVCRTPMMIWKSPVVNFSIICVHFFGRLYLLILLMASRSCFWMDSGEFNISVTMSHFIGPTRESCWVSNLRRPCSICVSSSFWMWLHPPYVNRMMLALLFHQKRQRQDRVILFCLDALQEFFRCKRKEWKMHYRMINRCHCLPGRSTFGSRLRVFCNLLCNTW